MARYARTRRIPDAAFSVALTAGRSVICKKGRGPSAALDEIDDREQQDPHEVDEVPVETERLDAEVVRRRVLAEERLARAPRDAHDAAEDVEAVETGHRVEGRAEERHVRIEALVQQVPVLDDLHRQE